MERAFPGGGEVEHLFRHVGKRFFQEPVGGFHLLSDVRDHAVVFVRHIGVPPVG